MRKLKIFILTCLVMLSTLFFSSCTIAKMPVPSVKEGRFNFSFTYEINGEEKNYSGVYVLVRSPRLPFRRMMMA